MNPQARDRQAKHTAAHPPDRTGREGTLPALNCGRQCLASNGSLKSGVVQASERSAVLRMKQGGCGNGLATSIRALATFFAEQEHWRRGTSLEQSRWGAVSVPQ